MCGMVEVEEVFLGYGRFEKEKRMIETRRVPFHWPTVKKLIFFARARVVVINNGKKGEG